MGAQISCVSCIAREQEEDSVKPLQVDGLSDGSEQDASTVPPVSARQSSVQPQVSVETGQMVQKEQAAAESELQAHINGIVNARKQAASASATAPRRVDSQLQDQINAMLKARKQTGFASPEPDMSHQSPCAYYFNSDEQYCTSQFNVSEAEQYRNTFNVVDGGNLPYSEDNYHEEAYDMCDESYNGQPHCCQGETCGEYAAESWAYSNMSPAAQSTDAELQEQINMIVGAHSKSLEHQRLEMSPTASPSPAKSLTAEELGLIANLALEKAKARKAPAPLIIDKVTSEEEFAPRQLSFADAASDSQQEPHTKCDKTKSATFNIMDIPSPTRSRAKKQQWASITDEEQSQVAAVLDTNTARGDMDTGMQNAEDAAKLEERMQRHAAELAMDKVCVETFLESVKVCAWRDRVRTPIKGTNLYTKHIRPCRASGTSVDVKDSTFRNLGSFLQFLEAEGLLCLKPGLTDPVVEYINFAACRKYKYDPLRRQFQTAPHGHSPRIQCVQ